VPLRRNRFAPFIAAIRLPLVAKGLGGSQSRGRLPDHLRPAPEGPGTGLAERWGLTMTQAKSKSVMVWVLIAVGVISGVAGALSIAVAYWIWATPRKELLALDLDRDMAGLMVFRGVPLLLLSVFILAATSIFVAAKKA
jgi:hypothetical protein